MAKGWIRLYRQSVNNPLYSAEPFDKWHAWQDLLLMVNHERKQFISKGQTITLEAGQTVTSIAILSQRWKWSENKVRRFFRLLNESGMCTADGRANGTIVTIENWAKYQCEGQAGGSTDGRPDGRADGRLTRMKRNKEGEEVYMVQPETAPSFSPPSISEVTAYVRQMGYGVDPEKFVAYYEARDWTLSRGQSMKDWKASVRYWEANKQEKTPGISNEVKVTIDDELDREIYGDKWS